MSFETTPILPIGTHNIRDLGGLPRSAGGQTAPRRVLRGCAMQHIGPMGRQALIEAGLRTVIDLRSDTEIDEAPPAFEGISAVLTLYHPVFADLGPIARMIAAEPEFRLQHRYARALELAAARFAAVIRAIADAEPGMVLIHCTAGKDRTGLIAAMLLDLAGVPRPAILADYARTADHGAALIATLRHRATSAGQPPALVEATLGCPPEAMGETLMMLDRDHGGTGRYLRDAGLDDATIEKAALRLLP